MSRREVLLSWYGITDLRAALRFEETDGPILAALKAHSYADVVVLAYLKGESADTEADFASDLDELRAGGLARDWEATVAFISKHANTQASNEFFASWLASEAEAIAPAPKVHLVSEPLRELNDTEGIYACAMRALDAVAREPQPPLVSMYLSPGTPVMAFVWAFAALAQPGLKKRLIASPEPSRAPEVVRLPADWIERFGRPPALGTHDGADFDLVFHLFGEQRMPSLIGMRQFNTKHHVFVGSPEYPAEVMTRFAGNSTTDEIQVDPFDPASVRDALLDYAHQYDFDTRIGFNLTGGTKLMYAGALSAARALGGATFYFDNQHRSLVFLDGFRREPIRPIESVDTFFNLHGDGLRISRKGGGLPNPSPDRAKLTSELWARRTRLGGLYKKLSPINREFKPFSVEFAGLTFELRDDRSASVVGEGLEFGFADWPRFAKYLTGGWFEEYVYSVYQPFVDQGVIADLRINLEIALGAPVGPPFGKPRKWDAFTELDVAFTDGFSLYLVECKAGNVTQEQVMKLQNLVRYYGGIGGKGIVAACLPAVSPQVKRKLADANLTLVAGPDLEGQVAATMREIAARKGIDLGQ